MEKLKDIVLIGFAVVGFISILSGFTEQQVYGTPESHVWIMEDAWNSDKFLYNKASGELRVVDFDKSKGYAKSVYKVELIN